MACNLKRLLFIRATADYPAPIIQHIEGVCSLLGIQMTLHNYSDLDGLTQFLNLDKGFDFVYVAAHGAHHCFGENSGGQSQGGLISPTSFAALRH